LTNSARRNLLKAFSMRESVGKPRTADVRVRPKEKVVLGDVEVTNGTANSIRVKKTAKGLVVTDCCLEEQGM